MRDRDRLDRAEAAIIGLAGEMRRVVGVMGELATIVAELSEAIAAHVEEEEEANDNSYLWN
jgi:hypothetical protein